jgi:hypothetical protein
MIDISDLTDLSTLTGHELIYCWEDPHSKFIFDFAIARLVEAVKRLKLPVMLAELDKAHVDFVRANRGIEEPRLARLRKLKVHDPILMARWPDGTHLTLDGNHRTVIAGERRQTTITFQVAEPELWRQFIIRIRRDGFVPVHSGITH